MNRPPPTASLPPLAGLCTMERALRPGLAVEESVRRLKRMHYAFQRLHHLLVAHIADEPCYELKMVFSLHAHYWAEHTAALRRRVAEMREPPLGLDVVPDPHLALCFDEILATPSTPERLLGLYELAFPALDRAFERHAADTHPLADAPSIRMGRFARLEIADMIEYGRQAVAHLVDREKRAGAGPWLDHLRRCLAAAGDLDGTRPGPAPEKAPQPMRAAQPFRYDGRPRRDHRFPDPYNMGVNAEVFLYDDTLPARPKTLMMYYKRLREIDVPEMMASIVVETPDKPWEYYRDMTRQLWDEARHAMMGEIGFASLNIHWPTHVMVNFTWSLALNTQLKPLERHAVLYFIEQGLMPKTGKRFEWETSKASGDPLATVFQDYDWADEVLHARIGRDWYLPQFEDAKKAVDYGDACWSKVLMGWSGWQEQGLTQHRNWWPDLYRSACGSWGIEPDPRVLAYATSYQTVRADLKPLTGSA